MIQVLNGILAVGMICLTMNARADWQWSKWGMSDEEVIRASQGKARPATPDETKGRSVGTKANPVMQSMLVVAPHTAGDFEFQAYFLFEPSTRKLMCVSLEPVNSFLTDRLRDQLVTTYGKPTEERRDVILPPVIMSGRVTHPGLAISRAIWVQDDRIELSQMTGSLPELKYCSKKNGSNSGL